MAIVHDEQLHPRARLSSRVPSILKSALYEPSARVISTQRASAMATPTMQRITPADTVGAPLQGGACRDEPPNRVALTYAAGHTTPRTWGNGKACESTGGGWVCKARRQGLLRSWTGTGHSWEFIGVRCLTARTKAHWVRGAAYILGPGCHTGRSFSQSPGTSELRNSVGNSLELDRNWAQLGVHWGAVPDSPH
jgi:hypothetical protein